MGYRVPSIDPARTALLVIDMQNDFVAEGGCLEVAAGQAMIPTLQRALRFGRERGIPIIYTAHVHRRSGWDMGLYDKIHTEIAARTALIDQTHGVEIHPDLAPETGEILIKKHRYSAFFGTDLEIILRGLRVETVVLTGVTTENCVHATARDAMFRDFVTVVLSDACATYDHPDTGHGALTAEEVHRASLVVLAQSTADVMTAERFTALAGARPAGHNGLHGARQR